MPQAIGYSGPQFDGSERADVGTDIFRITYEEICPFQLIGEAHCPDNKVVP